MEKSVTTDFHEYIREALGLPDMEAEVYSPLVLAYIGDCVFDLIIKSMVISKGNKQVQKLHEETSKYVQASAQSAMMRAMQPHLTEEEHAVYRRGRNTRSVSPCLLYTSMGDYSHIGVGHYTDAYGTEYWVQLFITK